VLLQFAVLAIAGVPADTPKFLRPDICGGSLISFSLRLGFEKKKTAPLGKGENPKRCGLGHQ